ncbi:AAA family ATPase [Roseomonas sp. BN140053]|uniref:AAA family ATPase n=1 Tax=Roseomonas sp. BN140053 TaxID=3391898 RepID=UPI0039ECF59A
MSADTEFDDAEGLPFEDAEPMPPPAPGMSDPALVAAEVMISAATANPVVRAAVTAPGGCVVVTTSGDWAKPVASVWKLNLLGLQSGLRNARGGPHLEVRSGPNERPASSDDHEAQVAAWAGKGALGVTPALENLSPSLVRSADITIAIPPMDAGILRNVVHRMTGTRPGVLPRGLSEAVQARHLRLARRPGQSAEDYVRRLAGLVAADRAAETRAAPPATTWTLDRLHGQPELAAFGRGLAADVAAYRRGELPWSDVPPGVLLSGPPGTGKTLSAQALGHACGASFFSGSFAAWESGPDGRGRYTELIARMRAMFAEAARQAPAIVFIDELDSFPTRGQAGHNDSYFTPITNALLECLDGVAAREGVIVVAATNHGDRIDPALRRAGRLDREIRLHLPDAEGLAAIIREHLGADLAGVDLVLAARAGRGGTGADAASWVRQARAVARHARRSVTEADLLGAIRGGEDRPQSAATLRRLVYHEAGHALAAVLSRSGMLEAVTIRGRGSVAGQADFGTADGDAPEDVDALLVALLAGRAAEEVVLGGAGAGCGGPAGSDLARATLVATSAELAWGLGERLTWRGDPQPDSLPMLLAANPAAGARVEARLQGALAAARDMLRQHQPELDAVADALLQRETLTGAEVKELVAAARQAVRTLPAVEAAVMAGGVR